MKKKTNKRPKESNHCRIIL